MGRHAYDVGADYLEDIEEGVIPEEDATAEYSVVVIGCQAFSRRLRSMPAK
jgi:hypothetical protein